MATENPAPLTVAKTREVLLYMGKYVRGCIEEHGMLYPPHAEALIMMFGHLDDRLARLETLAETEHSDPDSPGGR